MTATIKLTLNPGVWGETTAEHTSEYVRSTVNKPPCKTTVTVDSNTQITVTARGRERDVLALIKKLKYRCAITISKVSVESDKPITDPYILFC